MDYTLYQTRTILKFPKGYSKDVLRHDLEISSSVVKGLRALKLIY